MHAPRPVVGGGSLVDWLSQNWFVVVLIGLLVVVLFGHGGFAACCGSHEGRRAPDDKTPGKPQAHGR